MTPSDLEGMPEPDPAMLRAGDQLAGRYKLLEPIATGGMAKVWRATDLILGREVAVKILHPHLATDRGFLIRFRREAVAAARLSHRSIVAIYDTVSENGNEAIVMELIKGPTLRSVLDDQGQLSLADAIDVGAQISEALAEAHGGGIVHRDIKPSNILLCSDRRIMVTDFGIAKAGEETDLTVTGTLLGTAKYLAPEQVNGDEIDPRADLYSLGVVLFESLSGQPPFNADTDAATALARLHSDPPPLRSLRPDAPGQLVHIIDRLLQRDPTDRFQRALDVRAALSAVSIPMEAPADSAGVDPTDEHGPADQTRLTIRPDASTHTGSPQEWGATQSGSLAGAHQRIVAAPQIVEPELLDDADDDIDDDDEGFLRSERSWLVPALMLGLIATALIVAGALFARPLARGNDADGAGGGEAAPSDSDTTLLTPVNEFIEPGVSSAVPIDPFGDGTELNDLAGAAFDGDGDTFWRTDTYKRESFAGLKPGVGFLIDMGGMARVREIEIESDSKEYVIEVYVGSNLTGEAADAGEYGEPVAIIEGSGNEDVSLEAEGTQVLLWIVDHGTSDDGSDDDEDEDHRFELNEVRIS